ncbi:PAS domain S-box protein [Paenibacillus flagellatus]|uniref:histidine kinase n=1 Tax=Paenibacillus flagellatus TaxID=2211139 RepID=A0A2V5KDD3_9BACL|nr:PAS domain S-box protein [Paenibacillus flagellatus]PYI51920.1 hypothetical protein DLM86_23720 [Paenibacillus flagellatus]
MANVLENLGSIQHELLKSFITHMSDGIIIIDLEGKVLEVNPAFERLHGWTRDEVIGTVLPATPPHLLSEARRLHAEVLSGNCVSGYETVKLKKDGTTFYASLTLSPVMDETGRIVALVGVERDITAQKTAEKKLAESEERYRQLVELSPEPIVVVGGDAVRYANPAALELIGAERLDAVAGRPYRDFLHDGYAVELQFMIERACVLGKPSSIVPVKLIRSDRTPVDAEVKIVPFRSVGGDSVQLLFRDVSKRKKAEESLLEAEHLYQCLIENAMVGVYLYQNGEMVYANSHLADMLGYTREEMLRLDLSEVLAGDDMEPVFDLAVRTLEGAVSSFPFAFRAIRKDGRILHLEGIVTRIPYRGEAALLGTVQDVTYKKDVERELRESAGRYKRLIKFLPEPIVVSDGGTILYANRSAMKLVRAGDENELIGRDLFGLVHPQQREASRQVVDRVMETDEPSEFQERMLVCCDGQSIEAEMSSIRIHDFMGKTVTLTVLRDLTDRKRAEELLIRSEKLSVVGQLAAGLAHEIRNPLTSLKGFNQLLKARNPDQSAYYELMLTELERINVIVGDFMSLAKPKLSRFGFGSLHAILGTVISILSHQAIMTNVNLALHADETLPELYCEENQLKQVFINLIKNAIEAMPAGGEVTVTAERIEANRVSVKIRDRGPGIPEPLVQKLGEPFLTTKPSGTGLGLMISHRIVENHNGSIRIASRLGEGTVVDVVLPLPGVSPVGKALHA